MTFASQLANSKSCFSTEFVCKIQNACLLYTCMYTYRSGEKFIMITDGKNTPAH